MLGSGQNIQPPDALLSRAVESLDRDAYAARGVIYDREHKALLKRLISSSAPCTDADIAREERAFRDAVRRIEFPDPIARVARAEPAAPRDLDARREERTIGNAVDDVRIKTELAFGRDVKITTLIAAERPTLINFNTAAIAPPNGAI